jgi:hypothetical protein
MLKRTLAALLAICAAATAHAMDLGSGRDAFDTTTVSVSLQSGTGVSSLDSRRFPLASSAYRWGMAPFGSLPVGRLDATAPRRSRSSAAHAEMPVKSADIPLPPKYELSGEVGFFYGKSSGKFGGEDYAAYISGSIATENFRITAGASYHESTYRVPQRWR